MKYIILGVIVGFIIGYIFIDVSLKVGFLFMGAGLSVIILTFIAKKKGWIK